MSDEMEFEQELGPVEYVVFAFDGNEFNGEIIPGALPTDVFVKGMDAVLKAYAGRGAAR